jgi:ABC-2 type transport system ATP-binding protein
MPSLLQLNQLSHFYGSFQALSDVTVDVPEGAIGLVGQNGAGKSTLMQLMLGLMVPTKGTAIVLGQNVASDRVRLRGRIGYMPERDAFVPGLKGVEYVSLAGELYGMSRKQASRRAHETLSYIGLEEARYRKLDEYSVGMKQRIKLAAAMVHDPDLLLLDEPTSGLDPDGRANMLKLIKALASRPHKSLMLSSHLLTDIERVCDQAIILNRGELVTHGPVSALRSEFRHRYVLRWSGDAAAMLAELATDSVEIQTRDSQAEARLVASPDWQPRRVFELAAKYQVRVTGLEPEEENLEMFYHRIIQAQETH